MSIAAAEAQARRRRWRVVMVLAPVVAVLGVGGFAMLNSPDFGGVFAGVDSGDTSFAWTPDGLHIVVQRGQEDRDSLYELDADGRNPHRLLSGVDYAEAPSVSPDGRRVAFGGYRKAGATTTDIVTARMDGSDVRSLTHSDDDESEPAWSPNGRELAFVRGWDLEQESDLYLTRADGTGERRLTHGSDLEEDPTWSPDGKTIAYVAFPRLYLLPVGRPRARRAVTTALSAPAWSPDGNRIAVVEDWVTVKIVNLRTKAVRRIVIAATEGDHFAPDDLAWSPDGRRLAYTVGGSLYAVTLATGEIRRLTHCADGGDASCADSRS